MSSIVAVVVLAVDDDAALRPASVVAGIVSVPVEHPAGKECPFFVTGFHSLWHHTSSNGDDGFPQFSEYSGKMSGYQ